MFTELQYFRQYPIVSNNKVKQFEYVQKVSVMKVAKSLMQANTVLVNSRIGGKLFWIFQNEYLDIAILLWGIAQIHRIASNA